MNWYVVQCKPRNEFLAATVLEVTQDLHVYLPEVLQRRRGESRLTPLFPGYLFVEADLSRTPVSAINQALGVVKLVAFDDRPRALAPEVVAAIHQQVDALNHNGGVVSHPFRKGEPVLITDGPLQGLAAVFVGGKCASERVRVLLEFLGREQTVEVDVSKLETHRQPPPRPRRSRGHGRPIR